MQMISEQKVDSGCVQPAFSASTLLPAVLRLTLKKQWFDMIASGEKKEEYREIKDYWWMRLVQCGQTVGTNDGRSYFELPVDKWEMKMPKKYDYVEFKNGYSKDAPMLLVECKGIKIDTAKPEWSNNWQGKVFVIQLGKIVMSRV